jgi:hypothetical protein
MSQCGMGCRVHVLFFDNATSVRSLEVVDGQITANDSLGVRLGQMIVKHSRSSTYRMWTASKSAKAELSVERLQLRMVLQETERWG